MKQQRVVKVLQYMDELFAWYPLTELIYETPFQLLVAVIMSAQTTDKQVNKVNEQFFRVVRCPEDMVALGEWGIGDMIKTVWLWKSKTTNLFHMAKLITEKKPLDVFSWVAEVKMNIREWQKQYTSSEELFAEWWYWIPDTLEEMTKLPGVGIKTAKVVLYVLYGQRRVAVDTHVHRVMNRLGIVTTKTPEQTSLQLENIIPDAYKPLAHKVIIYFWRYRCMAKKPNCVACKLQSMCRWYQHEQKKL